MDHTGQLLIILYKAHRAAIANRLSAINMYPGQDGLLYHLSLKDGLSMSELVEKLQIRHPTLFTMVNRMETAGLIKKDKDKSDRRTSRVYLTGKGEKQVGKLSEIWHDIENQLLKGFSGEEKAKANSIINTLINNLN